MERTELYCEIQESLLEEHSQLENVFIDSVLDIFEDIVK